MCQLFTGKSTKLTRLTETDLKDLSKLKVSIIQPNLTGLGVPEITISNSIRTLMNFAKSNATQFEAHLKQYRA
jgi:hypothetical protein